MRVEKIAARTAAGFLFIAVLLLSYVSTFAVEGPSIERTITLYLDGLRASDEVIHPKDFEPSGCKASLHHFQFYRSLVELVGTEAEPLLPGAKDFSPAGRERFSRNAQERLLPKMKEHANCTCPVYGVDPMGFERNGWADEVLRKVQAPVTAMLDSAEAQGDLDTQMEVLASWGAILDTLNGDRCSSLDRWPDPWRVRVAKMILALRKPSPKESQVLQQFLAALLDGERVEAEFRRHHMAERSRLIGAIENNIAMDTREGLLARAKAQDAALRSEQNAHLAPYVVSPCSIREHLVNERHRGAAARRRDDQDGCLLRAGLATRRLLATALAIRMAELDEAAAQDPTKPGRRYLPAIPADPFSATSSPLTTKHTPQGWLIYSVGFNGTDDGGTGRDLAAMSLWQNGPQTGDLFIVVNSAPKR